MKKQVLSGAFVLTAALVASAAYEKLPLYETIPEWTLEWTDSAHSKGTIATDLTHGGWKLHVMRAGWYGGYALTVCSDPAKAGNRGVIEGRGFLDLRGPITGPSHENDTTNAVYRIGRMDDSVLRGNDGSGNATPAQQVTGLYTPGTLQEMAAVFHNDGNPRTFVRDIYIVEPMLKKLPDWLCSGCTSFKYITFDCPALTTIGGPICNCGGPQGDGATIFDEWNFPSVTTAGVKSNQSGSFAYWPKASGTLNLPSVRTINDSYAFDSTAMGGVILGTRGTLEYVGSNAFSRCSSLTNVVLGAQPAGTTLRFGTSAFESKNVQKVWLNGDNPLTCTPFEKTCTFGTSETAEGAITFYVRDTPGWAEVLAEADSDPNRLVSTRWFDTAQKQRVERWDGFVFVGEGPAVQIFDTRFVEAFSETITVETLSTTMPSAYREKGILGLPVRLTASCSDEPNEQGRKAHFHRWDGAPRDVERDTSIVIPTVTALAKIRPMFVHDWTYDTTADTICNGIWTIKVTVVSSSERTLRIGSTTGTVVSGITKSTAFMGSGYGGDILDFNGDIRDEQGQAWTITATSPYCMTKIEAPPGISDFKKSDFLYLPRVIVFPETVTTLAGNEFNFNNSRAWPLEEVIFIAPEYAGNINWVMNGALDMKRLLIRAPRLTTVRENAVWQGGILNGTDVTDWDLSGVTNIEKAAFKCSTGVIGTLSLPSLQEIGNNNFVKHPKLEGIVFATNLTLTTIGTNVCSDCTGLKSIVIGNAKAGLTIGEASFSGSTKPASVTFLGRYDREAADQVLAGTEASTGAKTATLSASENFRWSEGATPLTEDERAVAPEGVNGVYRDGLRKAWLKYTASPFDPRGMYLLFR